MIFLRTCFLAVGFGICVLMLPASSTAQSDPRAAAISTYLTNLVGVPGVTVGVNIVSEVIGCPSGQTCIGNYWLVTFNNGGDDSAQAVLLQSSSCASCFTVLESTGGSFSLTDIESLGVDPTTAQTLLSR